MPKSAHHNFRIVDKLFKFALCLLSYIPRIGVVSIFNNIAACFNRHIRDERLNHAGRSIEFASADTFFFCKLCDAVFVGTTKKVDSVNLFL